MWGVPASSATHSARPKTRAVSSPRWAGGPRSIKRWDGRQSGALPGLEGAHLPSALLDPAGLALEPGRGAVADVAGEEIVAGHPVLLVGRGDRRDGAASTGFRGLPR